jgi:hypothetical protein
MPFEMRRLAGSTVSHVSTVERYHRASEFAMNEVIANCDIYCCRCADPNLLLCTDFLVKRQEVGMAKGSHHLRSFNNHKSPQTASSLARLHDASPN